MGIERSLSLPDVACILIYLHLIQFKADTFVTFNSLPIRNCLNFIWVYWVHLTYLIKPNA